MSKDLALELNAYHTPEFARLFLDSLDREYNVHDLKSIEKGQLSLEREAINSQTHLIIQDTDLLTLWVWYRFKYNLWQDRVINHVQRHIPTLYLLCYPDLPWKPDTQRENENDREQLFNFYVEQIEMIKAPYKVIRGEGEERLKNALDAISELV